MNRSPEVVVDGHICLEIIPTIYARSDASGMLFRPGSLIETGMAIISTGGPVSNTGLVLHRLGVSTGLMGKVGDNLFGTVILDVIRGYDSRLTEGMIVAQNVEISYSIVLNPPGTDRIFLHNPGANDTFCADDVRYSELHGARLFHLGYPPLMKRLFIHEGIELKKIFKKVKQLGLTTSLDMAMPDPERDSGKDDWRRILRDVLSYVDSSVEEPDAVTGIIPWKAVQERIAAGWESLQPVIDLPEEWRIG
ncbi:carbohydrate kinase family protein [Effusibacillus lacus]|uniref:Carbohydrate kinase n=1 Tax=Effusibacillus lacus TaxID=1348429 RepID=A0A292YT87_9BACL|nr:carbohydrate kinase family protein [Effusibacillus lacus]TCS75915.1 hypothetical protein EDD64_10597 [Effusibacillus lacus]GAX91695.1 carbohydrate kinase [Effusibacillus lacus]